MSGDDYDHDEEDDGLCRSNLCNVSTHEWGWLWSWWRRWWFNFVNSCLCKSRGWQSLHKFRFRMSDCLTICNLYAQSEKLCTYLYWFYFTNLHTKQRSCTVQWLFPLWLFVRWQSLQTFALFKFLTISIWRKFCSVRQFDCLHRKQRGCTPSEATLSDCTAG